jgi:hypothetical protein
MRTSIFILFFLFVISASKAQNPVFFTGFFPEASITKKLKNENRINFKFENQHVIYDNRSQDLEQLEFRHYRTDLMSFYDWRLNPTKSFALGIFHRFQEGSDANRIIQQFGLLQRLRNLRIAHRFRTDQTFTKGEKIEIRFRYRLALEIPLNGATLDPGEHYLAISNEPIISYQAQDFELENRLIFSLGKLIQNGKRLEWSVDYRTDGYVEKPFRTRLWAKVGYFYSF